MRRPLWSGRAQHLDGADDREPTSQFPPFGPSPLARLRPLGDAPLAHNPKERTGSEGRLGVPDPDCQLVLDQEHLRDMDVLRDAISLLLRGLHFGIEILVGGSRAWERAYHCFQLIAAIAPNRDQGRGLTY